MSAHSPEFDDAAPEVFDFLELLDADLARGEEHPLAHYLARFPGAEDSIRREYLARRAPQSSEAPSTHEGPQQVGPYRLERELGRGGQGVVYLAEDTRIARRVALKLLPPAALLLSADRRARLRREAEVISKLDHPGICGIYDAEVTGDLAYLAMHYVEGETLGHLIARRTRARAGEAVEPVAAHSPPLYPEDQRELFALLEFFEKAARALHAVHEYGVVHRDIKPGNLMVSPSGQPVWLDFGQAFEREAGGVQLTLTGEVFGTPAYMSPEQLTGHRGALEARTDVWSLCVSLFEALTLERPFEGPSTQALLFSIQTQEARSARELNPCVGEELEVVLQTGLEKDLDRRYATAGDLAEELRRLRSFEPIQARPASAALKFRRWCRRHPVLFTSISGFVAMLVIGLLGTLHMLGLKDEALQHALGRHLAERATTLVSEDPAAALALGIEAVELAPSYQTRLALYTALERCYLAGELDGDPARRFRDIALTPDGGQLLAGLSDGSARRYDLATREQREVWATLPGEVTAVTCSPDGTLGACVDEGGEVVIVELAGDRELVRAKLPESEVVQLDLAGEPNSPRLTVSLASGERFLVRSQGVEATASQRAHEPEADVSRTFRSSDGDVAFLARAGASRWELRGADGETRVLGDEEAGGVLDAAFSGDGARLAVAASSGGVRLFDVATGRQLARFEGLLQAVKLLWTPDGEYVIAQTNGPFVQLWLATPRPDVLQLDGGGGPLLAARFSGDGERAATLSASGRARVFATPGASSSPSRVGALLLDEQYPGGEARSLAISDDGELIAVAGAAGLWLFGPQSVQLDAGVVDRVEFTASHGLLAVGERATWYELGTGAAAREFAGAQALEATALTPRADRLVLACEGGELVCFDVLRGDELWRSTGEGRAGTAVDMTVSPDGSELALAGSDRVVRFYSMADGTQSREPLGVFPPKALDWSADGSRLLVTGPRGRGAFMVKELASDQRMRVNVFHNGDLTSGAFSPDGRLVMTSSVDGTIFVRDVESGSPLVQLTGDGAPLPAASFSGGTGALRILAPQQNGYAHVWPVDPLPSAKARKPRELYEWEVAREVRLAQPLPYR